MGSIGGGGPATGSASALIPAADVGLGEEGSAATLSPGAIQVCESRNGEQVGTVCYRKCADLTQGTHPIRTTAFTCCRVHPCSPFNSEMSFDFSEKIDASCAADEEDHLDLPTLALQ